MPNETLHTCPTCQTPNFTTRGLKAHVCKGGNITLVKDEPNQSLNAEATACVSRFRAFHEAAKGSVLALKLAKFFAGIEVQTLCDLHEEMHGETRGNFSDKSKTDTPLSVLLEPYLEQHLNVTVRTARRYRSHFLSCTQEKPELAAKLRKWWSGWRDQAGLELDAGTSNTDTQLASVTGSKLALHEVCNLAAKDMQELLNHADDWGLHELFEVPLKDVTEEPLEEPGATPDAKERLAKFWLKDFSRRAMNNEFLKLRKQDREALLTTWEEATQKLKDSLKTR